MKKVNSILTAMGSLMLLASADAMAAGNTASPALVNKIETREGGLHSVFLSGGVAIPNEGCTLVDRAVINEYDIGGKTEVSVLLAALVSGKTVTLRVDGCKEIAPGSATTAPRIVKVLIVG
jgi:hypothetical protein